MKLEGLALGVHAMLAYGEDPLNVAVMCLKQVIILPPLLVNLIDEGA